MTNVNNPIFFALILVLITLPFVSSTTISIGDVYIEPGAISTAPVTIENVSHVGTIDITLFYNSSLVRISGASDSEFNFMHPVINNSAGYTRIGGMAYGDGLSGNVQLADLVFEAVGSADETCSLCININEIKVADATETTIPANVQNSSISIINPPQSPGSLSSTVGCHWINWTWIDGNNNDMVEVLINDTWVMNSTMQYYNCTVFPHTVHIISLRGYNSGLGKYSSYVNQTVSIPNFAPAASASSMHLHNNIGSVYECKTILDGSASGDPDGSITYYQWDFDDETSGTDEVVEHIYTSCTWNATFYEPFAVSLEVGDDLDPQIYDDVTIPVNVYIAGDTNADGKVNILDATLVGVEWGESCTDYWAGNENRDRADLNNDCKVNILDAVIIGACWGHTA